MGRKWKSNLVGFLFFISSGNIIVIFKCADLGRKKSGIETWKIKNTDYFLSHSGSDRDFILEVRNSKGHVQGFW